MRNLGHEQGCTEEKCATGCEVAAFHLQLDAPLMRWEVEAARRVEERWRQLLAGQIPA